MKVIGVVPARFASSRFPGKPLAAIAGKPMLRWVLEAAGRAGGLSELLVATDDRRIFELAESCGVNAVLTDSDLPTGSDRVWAAVKDRDADVVVNIQGDEPLLDPKALEKLVAPFAEDSSLEMSTLGRRIKKDELLSANSAKIVLNRSEEAIYFSRLPIPFTRSDIPDVEPLPCVFKHIGLYAYRKDFLRRYCEAGPCELEKLEGLEQLRALVMGARIRVVEFATDSWGVDTPEDVHKIEQIIHQGRK